MIFDYINDRTGFANGDLFRDEDEVREYFTVESMKTMFDPDYKITQAELDEMAKIIISNKWHIKPEQSRVFSIRINLNDSEREISKKIDSLTVKVRKFIS